MEGILVEIIRGIFALLALVAGSFATIAIKRLMNKYGIEINKEKEAQIRGVVQNAILFTEEWASKKIEGWHRPGKR